MKEAIRFRNQLFLNHSPKGSLVVEVSEAKPFEIPQLCGMIQVIDHDDIFMAALVGACTRLLPMNPAHR